ncbi:DeoR/GlpR family DNA-binding transcription regulator [Streptococcus cuniculi]|uniref:DeoR/GlpR transcriptional regulator n=1 Tax=Streptococcus cuniculi TaxID=1432788 RepID=A0A4Y9J8K8_9STRE|nr:DeoR/GlpR family DNA-binding transcription regulator [Streptococcus cuniculi]MBF0778830.1 DeoR/GlpR transcriptional regulator [Streptococcus cuniculi]TFU97212.1 DeoR/GlpR transcriptional regulator [Streptococcus cuniculi]
MYQEERHRKILDILSQKKSIRVKDLSEELGVSRVTIRNDLAILSQKKLVDRSHGKVSVIDSLNFPAHTSYNFRSKKNDILKQQIAQKAFALIQILIDASSTAYELSKLISQSSLRLTVLTNGMMTAELLKDVPNITTILIGGILRGRSNAIESTLGAEMLLKMNINKLFVSAHSFNLADGLSDFNIYEVELKKMMVKHSEKVIALIDSSKLENSSVATFLSADQIDTFITDDHIPANLLEKYRHSGLHIV